MLVRHLGTQAEEPTLGVIFTRRYVCMLGPAVELAPCIQQALHDAGWQRIPIEEILGDGAPWIWKVADAYVPGVRQTLDCSQLGEHLDAFAHLLYPNNPTGAKAWVDQNMGALLTDRVGEVLGVLKRMRPRENHVCDALSRLIGSAEHNRTRIRYQAPWHSGPASRSGSVEGACKQVIHSSFSGQGCAGNSPAFSMSWPCGSPNSTGRSRPSGPAEDSRSRSRDDLQNEGTLLVIWEETRLAWTHNAQDGIAHIEQGQDQADRELPYYFM